MKKFLLLCASVLALLLSFGCCASINSLNPTPPHALIPHLKNSTATLVNQAPNGKYVAYCGAVWINRTDLLTARHCVEDDNNDVEIGSTIKYQIYSEFDNNYPYSENTKVYVAKVVAAGEESEDIAVLRSVDSVSHGIATIATYEPTAGQVAHHVGHPKGLQWSYIKGIVSAQRILNFDGKPHNFLNVTGFMWTGSSGGGTFDNKGNLMGICSIFIKAPGQFFFVHVEVIREVLSKNDIKYHTLN